MHSFLEHFITQSTTYALIAVWLVAFLESLALVGLLMPGTVIMAALGALIGSGQLGLYQAWLVATTACLVADWISFWLGWRFKKPLHNWSFLQKQKAWLDKTEYALHRHSLFTVLVGRFIGPTRPLVPLVAGMLDLPVRKFIVPNVIGCIFWPPFYFLPGILAGAAIDIPSGSHSGSFIGLLVATALLVWLAGWLCWRWWRSDKRPAQRPARKALRWMAPLACVLAIVVTIVALRHPLMPVYVGILGKVFDGI